MGAGDRESSAAAGIDGDEDEGAAAGVAGSCGRSGTTREQTTGRRERTATTQSLSPAGPARAMRRTWS